MFRSWLFWLTSPITLFLTPFTWPWVYSKNRHVDVLDNYDVRMIQIFMSIWWIIVAATIEHSLYLITPSCLYCIYVKLGIKRGKLI